MSNHFNNTDLIEAYLEGKLSPQDKIEFENRIQQDPLLESEVQFQKDIIGGLKDFRVAELKNRLDHIQVGTGTTVSGVKIAATVLISSMLAIGTYFYVNFKENKETEQNSELAINEVNTSDEKDNQIVSESKTSAETVLKENTPQGNSEVASSNVEENTDKTNSANAPSGVTRSANENKSSDEIGEIVSPKVVEDFDDSANTVKDNFALPQDNLRPIKEDNISKIEIENKKDNKHKLHYQYENNKLFLYGDFKDIPYEILELNTAKGKSLYMFYNNSYYTIRQDQKEIAPLEIVNDKKLIKELDLIKDNK